MVLDGIMVSSSDETDTREAINPTKIKKRIIVRRKIPSMDANIILKKSFIRVAF
jgi:hypothetical protein